MKIFTLAHLAISLAGILSGFVVLVVQSFFYVPVLKAIAPTQNESPFKLAQLSVLLAFINRQIFSRLAFVHARCRSLCSQTPNNDLNPIDYESNPTNNSRTKI